MHRILAFLALAAASCMAHAGEVTVSAAASLTNAFKDIARQYEARHPGSKVLLNFGASGALLQQIARGAPVDVFACADQETMDAAHQGGHIAPGVQTFAQNALVLIAPSDSKLAFRQLADLGQSAVQKIAMGNPASVPVGRYTQHALESAKLWTSLAPKMINTQNVRQALDYVARGEVDAGFVYATDAAIMPDKVKVAFQVSLDTAISYPIARVAAGPNADEAKRFITFVMGPEAQAVLARYGFQKSRP